MEHSIHQSEDRLELYALGRLPDSDIELIEEHLLTCAVCCERLEDTGVFAGSMREALRQEPVVVREKEVSSWFAWLRQPRFAMAGAFAAVLLAVGLYWANGGSRLPAMATLQLTAMRGDMQSVDRANQLDLTLSDAPEMDKPFQVELVDASGSRVWSGNVAAETPAVHTRIDKRLAAGDYFVRLYGASGKLLHEYGFRVRG